MIPYCQIDLSKRHAKVLNIALPTENHGGQRIAYLDIKLQTLITKNEIDAWLAIVGEQKPSQYIFDSRDHDCLRLPDISQVGDLRDKIEGTLMLEVGTDSLELDARTVGSVNKLEFRAGGSGVLTMQFRTEASDEADKIARQGVEKGECMMAFSESDESASTKHPENTKQGDMPV